MVKFHGHIYDTSNGVVTYPNENGSSVVLYCDFVVIGHSFDGTNIYGICNGIFDNLPCYACTSKQQFLSNYLHKYFIRKKIGHTFYFVPVPYVIF